MSNTVAPPAQRALPPIPPRLVGPLSAPPPPERRARPGVSGLLWVEAHRWPSRRPKAGSSDAARAGLRFERNVGLALKPLARELGALVASGLWLKFEHDLGVDWAQPDHFLVLADRVLVLECKLSQTDDAFHQLETLYEPLLRELYGLPTVGVQVCHYLREAPATPVRSLQELALGPLSVLPARRTLHCHDPRRLA